MKIIPAILSALFLLSAESHYSQQNHKTITWSGILFEIRQAKMIYTSEVENSHRVLISQQDYFTTLVNTEYDFGWVQTGLGSSYWLLYSENGMIVPEWRPHEQIRCELKRKRFELALRARMENRFTRDTLNNKVLKTHTFSLRPRLLFQLEFPLIKTMKDEKKLDFVFSEEIATTIKQNKETNSESRMYFGLWYQLNGIVSMRAGYLWLSAQDNTVNNSDIFYFTLKLGFQMKRR